MRTTPIVRTVRRLPLFPKMRRRASDYNPAMAASTPPAGLCGDCAYARVVTSGRGSAFLLCGRAATDRRYRKYPPLPMLRCDGYEQRDDADEPPQ